MTVGNISSKKKETALSFITAFLILILLCCSRRVSAGIYSGTLFAAKCLIPTLFPFFIISDMIFSFGLPFSKRLKNRGNYVIIIGVICGFPHGARCATKLLEDGKIDAREYERLIVLSNSPSLAFIVSGIGAGMLGSSLYGLILYIVLLCSVATLSLFYRSGQSTICISDDTRNTSFSLIDSIKRAGISSITVASFVIFFHGVCALISEFVSNEAVSLIISSILEIASGASRVASNASLGATSKMFLLGFIVGFSSISTFMQTLAFVTGDVNKRRLFAFKIVQGLLCAIYALILTIIYKKWLL